MSLIMNSNVFLIIPVYNEKKEVLEKTVHELLKAGYSIVVIDDGSKEKIVFPNQSSVFVLRHSMNLGQGAALQTGIHFALDRGAQYIISFDADGQHSAADIPAMLLPLQNNSADITLASRFLKGGNHNASFLRKLVLNVGRYVNYIFTGLYLSDAHNGLRAMTPQSAKKLIIKENRMAHATEILFVIKKHQLKFLEVPTTVIYTEYSKRKGQSVFNSIRIFFDLILHKLFE